MSLFNLFKGENINTYVEQFRNTPGAVLIDVRTVEEFKGGHIPDAVNIPLSDLGKIRQIVPDTTKPLFVHCLSGGRSRQAVSLLKGMGYSEAVNIGGIGSYRGETVR